MINLRKITEDNFLDAFRLKLAEGQEEYVSHPIRSLAQAYVYRDQCQPFGIYAGDEMVGYVMVIYDYDIPEYDIWHSRWFPPDANPSLTADKMEFLEYFLNGKKWAVIPLLVARRFKRQDVWICPMEGGPEDMTIYGLTKENRMDDQIRRFFQCVREELQMIDGIELFSGR